MQEERFPRPRGYGGALIMLKPPKGEAPHQVVHATFYADCVWRSNGALKGEEEGVWPHIISLWLCRAGFTGATSKLRFCYALGEVECEGECRGASVRDATVLQPPWPVPSRLGSSKPTFCLTTHQLTPHPLLCQNVFIAPTHHYQNINILSYVHAYPVQPSNYTQLPQHHLVLHTSPARD